MESQNKYLTIQQTKELLDGRPKGTSPQEILAGLTSRGYSIEGMTSTTPAQPKADTRSRYEIAMGINEPEEVRNARNEKIAKFVGFDKLAKGLGYTISNMQGNQDMVIDANQMAMDVSTHLQKEIKERKGRGDDTSRMEKALVDLEKSIAETSSQIEEIGTGGLTNREVLGSAIQTASLALPVGKIAKGAEKLIAPFAGKLAPLAGKVIAGGATGYGFDVGSQLQDKEKTTEEAMTPSIGTAVGASLPVAGYAIKHLVVNPLGRLIKGLGSGFSGVGTDTIDAIKNNPQVASQVDDALKVEGNAKVLQDHAKQVVEGVSTIKKQAREAYGTAIQELADTDINPKVFRSKVQPLMDKFGVVSDDGVRTLNSIEFETPSNIAKAEKILQKVNDTKLDGKSLKKAIDFVESKKYNIATSDERLAFNHFVNEISSGLKTAINESTDKLGEMNAKYSQDMQLAQSIEQIFGKVKFKNMAEINKVSQKLESLFSQKGLSPEYVDDFFTRLGMSADDFKTGEAVRQISNKSLGSNGVGTSIGEILRAGTSSIITPKMVKDVAIATGKTEQFIKGILGKVKDPSAGLKLLQEALHSE